MRTINGVGCLHSQLANARIGIAATAVFSLLLSHADANGYSFPSIRRLAEILSCCKDTVEKAIDLLESERMIAASRPGKGKRGYNRYRILPLLGWKSFDAVLPHGTLARKTVLPERTAKPDSVLPDRTEVYDPRTSPLEYPPVAVSCNDGSFIEFEFWEWCASLPIHGKPLGSARLISPRTRRKGLWALNRAWNQHEWFRKAQADIWDWYSMPWTKNRDLRKRGVGALLEDFADQAQEAAFHLSLARKEGAAGNVIRLAERVS